MTQLNLFLQSVTLDDVSNGKMILIDKPIKWTSFDAVQFVKAGSEVIGGKGGGGRKDFAQAGGQDQSKINEAFEKIKSLI